MNTLSFYFFLFITFSVIGWFTECVSCTLWYRKFIHNRGFLLGPCCPVYGFGAVFMYVFLSKYENEPVALFTMAVVGTSIIEYIASVIMEKIFRARWWDYTKEPFNINGRVCLKNSILFGIMGLGFIYYVKPIMEDIAKKIPTNTFNMVNLILFIILMIDVVISFILMTKIKKKIVNIRHDSTEDIDKEIKNILKDYKYYFKNLFRAFPGVSFNLPKGEDIVKSITKTLNTFDITKKSRKETKKKL